MTQDDLACLLFIDRSHISRIETGKLSATFDELLTIAYLFRIPLSDLVFGVYPPLPQPKESGSLPSGRNMPVQDVLPDTRGWGFWEYGAQGWEHMLGKRLKPQDREAANRTES